MAESVDETYYFSAIQFEDLYRFVSAINDIGSQRKISEFRQNFFFVIYLFEFSNQILLLQCIFVEDFKRLNVDNKLTNDSVSTITEPFKQTRVL